MLHYTVYGVAIYPIKEGGTCRHWHMEISAHPIDERLEDYTSLHPLRGRKALWVGYQRPCPTERTLTAFTQGLGGLCHSLVLELKAIFRHDGSKVPPPCSPHGEARSLLRRGRHRSPADVLHFRLPDTGSRLHVNVSVQAPRAQLAPRLAECSRSTCNSHTWSNFSRFTNA